MRETRTSGSVRGASGDGRPYRERNLAAGPDVGEGLLSMLCRPPSIHDLRSGEPPEGQLDGGEGNEGGQGFGKVLEVLGKTPVSAEPGEGALDHPAARQDDE